MKSPDHTPLIQTAAPLADVHRFACDAMATTFEVFIRHSDKNYAEQAAWAAFDEAIRLETLLSRYQPNSEIAQINVLSAETPLTLSLETFECLSIAREIAIETDGVFDVTAGVLYDIWLDKDNQLKYPTGKQLQAAKAATGSILFRLDEANHTITLDHSPLTLDLGAIGKGFAADRMAAVFKDWDINSALICAGPSTVLPIGSPKGHSGWPVTISDPAKPNRILQHLELRDTALSGSGIRKGMHIIDPRTAQPAGGNIAAWSTAPDAARADALSTAFMIMSPEQAKEFCKSHPDISAMVISAKGKKISEILRTGIFQR